MIENLTTFVVTQEIDTAHTPLHLSEQLTPALSKRGYKPDKKESEAFVWKRQDRKGVLYLNYYTQANSLTLRRSFSPKLNENLLQREARNALNDLSKITDELAVSVGHPHLSTRIQLEFGVEGDNAQTVLETVLPTVKNSHSVKHGHVNVDVDLLESAPQTSRALLTPFNLIGE